MGIIDETEETNKKQVYKAMANNSYIYKPQISEVDDDGNADCLKLIARRLSAIFWLLLIFIIVFYVIPFIGKVVTINQTASTFFDALSGLNL